MIEEVDEKESKYDYYGFSNQYKYDRTKDYPVFKPKMPTAKVFFISVASLIAIFWLVASCISGYYAWTEFPGDPTWVKFIRLYVAVLFSPIYLFYIFMKTTVFKET
uniref:Uncharacterized protein n=1 Tax=viral metagenome TaxID=1070528 RepID=A0A6C0JID9_9ZZZZ